MTNHPNRKRSGKPGETPTPDLIRFTRETRGLTQKDASIIVHTNERSWQKWELGERRMHPAFWELFLIKSGAAT